MYSIQISDQTYIAGPKSSSPTGINSGRWGAWHNADSNRRFPPKQYESIDNPVISARSRPLPPSCGGGVRRDVVGLPMARWLPLSVKCIAQPTVTDCSAPQWSPTGGIPNESAGEVVLSSSGPLVHSLRCTFSTHSEYIKRHHRGGGHWRISFREGPTSPGCHHSS